MARDACRRPRSSPGLLPLALALVWLLRWARAGFSLVVVAPTSRRTATSNRRSSEHATRGSLLRRTSWRRETSIGRGFRTNQRDTALRSSATDDATAAPIEAGASPAPDAVTATVDFPPYQRLMRLSPGEYEASDPILVGHGNRTLRFRAKLYPKGGGHSSQYTVLGQRTKSGFGMSYRVLPFFSRAEESKVGVYLEFLPDGLAPGRPAAVDASFGLRLRGRQRAGARFDVEFRSGMRFVADPSLATLKEGRARDFGSHLMKTSLLGEFLGIGGGDVDVDGLERESAPVQLQVSLLVHNVMEVAFQDELGHSPPQLSAGRLTSLVPRDVRGEDRGSRHDSSLARTGRIVVPVLTNLAERPGLFRLGAYPGVEYRIMRVLDPATGRDVFYSRPGADYEMRPLYPLVAQLERPWPVRVNEKDLPRLYTPAMYNTVSALASLFTAVAGLVAAFCVSQAVSLFFIPSHSMDPTLEVGDVLLVDKVTPRLFRGTASQKVGDVVLFHPPQKLQEIVSRSGAGKPLGDRDLFVKRIAAVAGDVVTVRANGQVLVNDRADGRNRDLCAGPGVESYLEPGNLELKPGEVAVLGDCARVSIDSRVWGPLPSGDIVGRPLLRLWPISRFGSIPSLPLKDL